MPLTDYPFIDIAAKTREINLDNPPTLDQGIIFFLEIKSLMTGRLDRTREKAPNGSPVDIQRVWQFTSPDIQPPIPEPPVINITRPATASPTTSGAPANTGELATNDKK
jgi:hypothetical protein